jgi:hypothetical protein
MLLDRRNLASARAARLCGSGFAHAAIPNTESKGYSIGCTPFLLIDNLNLFHNAQLGLTSVRQIESIQISYWQWAAFAVTIPKSADSAMVFERRRNMEPLSHNLQVPSGS